MDVISRQLQAYSKKDLASFLSCYHPEVKVYMLQSGITLAEGIDQLEQVMAEAFESEGEETRTEVLKTIKQGNLIVNHEKIYGHTPGKIIFTVSIYEVTEGLISQLWFGGRSAIDI